MFSPRLFSALLFLTLGAGLRAQDAHFTQIQNLPLLINPAHSGLYSESDYRAGTNYRLQKTPSGGSYNTFVGWADVHMQPLYNGGWFGLGLSALRDNTSGSVLVLYRYILSVAYHHVLSDNAVLSIGLGGSYSDRRLDRAKLVFGDQFDGSEFSHSIPTAEVLFYPNSHFWALEPAINFAYSMQDNSQLHLGFAMDNVNRPATALIGGSQKLAGLAVNSQGFYIVPLRYHANASYSRQVGSNLTWNIYTYFSYQNHARQTLLGSELAYDYNFDGRKVLELSGGLMYRVNRSANVLLGLESRHVKLNLSYDLAITRTGLLYDNYNSFEVSCTLRSVFPKSNRARKKLNRRIRCVNNFDY